MRRVIILGSSGTIGQNALRVCLRCKDALEVAAVHVHGSIDKLALAHADFPDARLIVSADDVRTDLPLYARGADAIRSLIMETDADIVLNGISGSAGYYASFWTLESGKDLALANKESLVMAGPLLQKLAKEKQCRILPVDSEHWALFSLLKNENPDLVSDLILTASGGPFFHYSQEQLRTVTPEEAVRHPTWAMGAKISIDSATLANKGLEVIEAWRLFNLPPENIKVAVHRQSLVHAMIRMKDGAFHAHISRPDMQLSIQDALLYPDMRHVPVCDMNLEQSWQFGFDPVPTALRPMLDLAYQACQAGGAAPVVYNAANEAAVQLFREKKIGFLDLGVHVSRALQYNIDNYQQERDAVFSLHQDVYARIMKNFE